MKVSPVTHRVGTSRDVRSMLADVSHMTGDHGAIARRLVTLAADVELFAPAMAELHPRVTGATWLHLPARGPRLALVHRPAGHMAAIHDHHVWVTLAPITGVETHELWEPGPAGGDLVLSGVRDIYPGDAAWLVPPNDTHSHGHLAGHGPAPYTLVLLGDNMLRTRRTEYDPVAGTWRYLLPGDAGNVDRQLV